MKGLIQLYNDNILVEEIKRDSKAGNLIVNQDESSAYMFCKVLGYSKEAESNITFFKDCILVVQRTAKIPYIQNTFFVSYKDVVAVVNEQYLEEL